MTSGLETNQKVGIAIIFILIHKKYRLTSTNNLNKISSYYIINIMSYVVFSTLILNRPRK